MYSGLETPALAPAQDMFRHGADEAAVQAGRWKTHEMLARYSRRLNARRGAVAKKLPR